MSSNPNEEQQQQQPSNTNNNVPTGKEILDIKTYTPNRDQEIPIDIKDPNIWSCFPLGERFWYSFCCKTKCCSDYKDGTCFTSECIQHECKRDKNIQLSNKIFSISILRSGTLDIEPMIIHPFVRFSIINLKTGKYLQKTDFRVACLTKNEKNFIIQHNKIQSRLDFQLSALDFIPPMSTCPYDLREKGESFAEWNEEFIINESADYIFNTNHILLFEMLDYNLNFKGNSVEECVIPIAWGYLKLVGFSKTYLRKHKIQLYKYKFNRSNQLNEIKNKNKEYLRTPDVLYEIDWIRKEKYQTFLQIELNVVDKPSSDDMQRNYFINKYGESVFAEEGDKVEPLITGQPIVAKKKPSDDLVTPKRLELLKWKRDNDEKCYMPSRLLYKFHTAKLGCLTHEFSRDGHFLAAACTELSSETSIKIFNVEDGTLRYHFKGHHQIIHHFVWSFDNLILISASADNNVSLWRVPQDDSNDMENLEYLDNERKFLITSLFHPAYVYACDIFPNKTDKMLMILATACFDGIIRIYTVYFNYDDIYKQYTLRKASQVAEISITANLEDRDYFKKVNEQLKTKKMKRKDRDKAVLLDKTALDHRHPNTIVFDHDGQLYIGDSLGYIHIWELRIINKVITFKEIRVITHKELEHDTINKITLVPNQSKRLLIHSRDNCIRLLDISTETPRVVVRYFGLKCNKINIKSTISPDASYILSGSEEGVPHVWSMESAIPYGTNRFECGFVDGINDVSWNNGYHMIALSAFGQEHPLMVYVYEKDEEQVARRKERKNKKDKMQTHIIGETPGEEDDYTSLIDEKEGYYGGKRFMNNMNNHQSDLAKQYQQFGQELENK